MFTGIVQCVGRVRHLSTPGGDARLSVEAPDLGLEALSVGDSVAVNGCCLTAVSVDSASFEADVSGETLACTTLGGLDRGSRVNLEKALTLATPLGGHLVSAHVDGLGEVISRRRDGRSERWRFQAPAPLTRYIAVKGSICVDGISLTVNAVDGAEFEVNIVPHTSAVTTFGERRPGCLVNLEVDLIARYLERLIQGEEAAGTGGVTRELLRRHGFAAD